MTVTAARRLVIAFIAPPYNDASSVTLMKRILEHGAPFDLVSADLSRVRTADPSLLDLLRPLLRRHVEVETPAFFSHYNATSMFMAAAEAAMAGAFDYDEIYSRSMWPHSHFLAALWKTGNPQVHWTAEFSDPHLWHADGGPRPSGDVSIDGRLRRILGTLPASYQSYLLEDLSLMAWAQNLPYILADTLVFTNEQQLAVMLEGVPTEIQARVLDKAEVSPHPTPPRELYESTRVKPRDTSVFRIGYFGTFYPNRGGGEFLEALSLLPEEERLRVELHVYSDSTDHLMLAARTLGIADRLRIHEPLPYLAFLQEAEFMDALLVNDIATIPFSVPSPFLPSKYADYRGSSVDIMAITLPGSPLDSMPIRWKTRGGSPSTIIRMIIEAMRSSQN